MSGTISSSSIPDLVGLSLAQAFNSPAVQKVMKDIAGFDLERLRFYLESESTADRRFYSRSSNDLYEMTSERVGEQSIFRLRRYGQKGVTVGDAKLYLAATAVLLAIILAGTWLVFSLRQNMLAKKFEESRYTVEMVSGQIDNTINSDLNSWLSETKLIGSLLDGFQEVGGNEDVIDAILESTRKNLPFADVGILLRSGDLYFSKDRSYNVSYEQIARKLIENESVSVVDVVDIGSEEKILFGTQIAGREKQQIVAVCGVADVSAINKLISVDIFQNQSVEAIIKDDGFCIALSENVVTDQTEDANFFQDIRDQKSDEEFRRIESDFLAGNSGMFELYFSSQNYYVYYSAVGKGEISDYVNGWHFVVYVPQTAVSGAINSLFNTIIGTMVTILFFAVATTGLCAFVLAKKHGSDQRLKNQVVVNSMLEKAADRAVEASVAKTVFLSNMSHDIRTPINGIIGMTTVALRHENEPEVVHDCLNKIDRASTHLLSLVNDVLDMSRIESKRVEIAQDVVNVRILTEECCSIISGQIAGRDVAFRCTAENLQHPDVIGDALHLRQILINILGNSVKFTPDGGKIDFVVEELPGGDDNSVRYVFTVADTGCGMSQEFLTRLFQPFAQEKNDARSNYAGTGLGLSIAGQLCELMGGSIDVQSKIGVGSTFRIEIPFTVSETAIVKRKEEELSLTGTDFAGVRVLLVEDNELNREIAEMLLTESGLTVECAVNGKEACDKFFAHEKGFYDVVLMDVMMPEMDGLTATRTIRSSSHEDAKTVPIIAMTANAFADDVKKTRAAGMNAHLSKPIRINEVLAVLACVIAGRRQQESDRS